MKRQLDVPECAVIGGPGNAGQRCGLLLDKAEQRSQRAAARLNRVRSTLTQEVRVIVGTNLSVHAV